MNQASTLSKRARMLVYLYGWMTEEQLIPDSVAQELTIIARGLADKAKEPGRLFLALGRHGGAGGDAMVFMSTTAKVKGAIKGEAGHFQTGKGIYQGIKTEPNNGKIYDLSMLDTVSHLDCMDMAAFQVRPDLIDPVDAAGDAPLVVDEDGNELTGDQVPERYR